MFKFIIHLDVNKLSKSSTSKNTEVPKQIMTSKSEKNCEAESIKKNQKILATETIGSPTLTEGLYICELILK